MQNHSSQRRELPTAIVLLVSAFALFAFSLGISADAGPPASSCPYCGLTADDLSGHKCSPTPLTPKQLAIRKHEAHALSDKSQSDWSLGASDGVPASDLSAYIKSKEHLIALGKGLFWDQRVGSDDRTACATCHYHAGVDTRTKHTDSATNPAQIRYNHQWSRGDYVDSANVPETGSDAHAFGLIRPTNEKKEHQTLIIGSQGIRPRVFTGLEMVNGVPTEKEGRTLTVEERSTYHIPPEAQDKFRQVTRRNASTIINSTLLSRLFADGRAQPMFNGHDAFGDSDGTNPDVPTLRNVHGKIKEEPISLPMAAAASQALAPLRSVEEMGYVGRQPWDVAAKLLLTRPLLLQEVSIDDSVLGKLADPSGKGLSLTYQKLIELAFHEDWWDAPVDFKANFYVPPYYPEPLDADGKPLAGKTGLQAINFPLYFGLAIMAYEQTLVSDDSAFDRFCRGDTTAMSRRAIRGFEKFRSYGCADCHLQPEFAGATVSSVFGDADPPDDGYEELGTRPRPLTRPLNTPNGGKFVEEMKPPELRRGLLQDTDRFFAYDGGFYNIGVTALEWSDGNKQWPEDWGVGTTVSELGIEHSRARKLFPGENLRHDDQSRVRGAFKTPSLRNIELTKPYMHNGAFLTLEDVMAFYERGPREFDDDHPDAKYWHHPALPQLRENLTSDSDASADIIAFMKALTDERVRRHAAPFDHPSLELPVGTKGGSVSEAPPKLTEQLKNRIRQASIAERPKSLREKQEALFIKIKNTLNEKLTLSQDTLSADDLAQRITQTLASEKTTIDLQKSIAGSIEELREGKNLNESSIVDRLVRIREIKDIEQLPSVQKPEEATDDLKKLPAIGRNGSDDPLAGVSNWDNLP